MCEHPLLITSFIMDYDFRENNASTKKLRKILSDVSKKQRQQRINLNIQITFLTWFMEFLGFFLLAFGSFVLTHKSSVTTLCLQIFTELFYFVFVPSMLLINSDEFKERILESNLFLFINGIFHRLIVCHEEYHRNQNDDVEPGNQNFGENDRCNEDGADHDRNTERWTSSSGDN